MGGTLGRLNVLLELSSGAFVKGLDQAQKKLDGFSKWAKDKGRTLTTFVTAPIVGGFALAINAASDLNEAMSAVETVFGSAASDVAGFTGSVARSLGLSRQEALSASAALGAFGQGMGLTGQELSKFSNEVLSAASDLGSFYNVPVPEMLDAIRSGLAGEIEPLRRYGIMLDEATLKKYALSAGIWDGVTAMTEEQKFMARHLAIQGQLGAAEGDRARTAGSLANMQKQLASSAKDVAAAYGQFLLPIAIRVADALIRLTEWFGKLSPATQKIVLIVAGLVAALGPLLLIFGHLAGALVSIMTLFGGTAKAADAAADVTGAAAKATRLSLLSILGPIALIAAAVGLFYLAYTKNWFGIRDITNKVIGKIVQHVKYFIDAFRDLRRSGIDPVSAAFMALRGTFTQGSDDINRAVRIINGIETALRFAIRVVQDAVKFVNQLREAFGVNGLSGVLAILAIKLSDVFGGAAAGVIIRFFQQIIEHVGMLIDAVQTAVALVGALMAGDWSQAWDLFQQLAGQAVELVIDFLLILPQTILDIFNAINWGAVGSLLLAGALLALDFLADLGVRAWNFVKTQFDAINWGDLISDVGSVLWNAGGSLIGGLRDGAVWVFDNVIKPWASGLPQRIVDAITDAGSSLFNKGEVIMSDLWDGFTGFFDDTIVPYLVDLPGSIAGLIVDGGSALLSKGRDLLSYVWDGISQFFNDTMTGRLNELPGSIAEQIVDGASALLAKGRDLLSFVWDGISQFFNDTMTGRLNALPGSIAGKIVDGGSALLTKGKELLALVWNGMVAKLPDLFEWLRGLPGRVAGQIVDSAGSMYSAGGNLVQGLINGIVDKTPGLRTAVNTIISIWNSLPIWGGEGSPWKRMIGWGHDAMRGLEMGFQDRMPMLARTMDDVSGTIGGLDSFGMRTPGLALAGAAVGAGQGSTTNTVTIQVSGAGDPDVVADRVLHVLARELGLREGT